MHLMLKFRVAAAVAVLSLAALLAPQAAGAAPSLVVTAGSLGFDGSAPTFSAFNPVTLSGQPQLTSAVLDTFTVVDATGSSLGWNAAFSMTDLVNGASTIPVGNIIMLPPKISGAGASNTTGFTLKGVNDGTTPLTVSGTSVKIVSAPAAANSGGTFLVSPDIIKVIVPWNAIAGTYAGTGTLTLVSGP
jgi:hypothetical protein